MSTERVNKEAVKHMDFTISSWKIPELFKELSKYLMGGFCTKGVMSWVKLA